MNAQEALEIITNAIMWSRGDNYCFNCGQALDWSDT